jgi:hypothetical protein
LLQQQPDFQEQKALLQEIIDEAVHLMLFYPKYHCELNWIERYLSVTKPVTRAEYSYSFKPLREHLDKFLGSICSINETPTNTRRFYNTYWKFINAISNLNKELIYNIQMLQLSCNKFYTLEIRISHNISLAQ